MLTQEDIKNLLALINLAPIKGGEAITVALLLQKLKGMIASKTEGETEGKTEGKTKK